MLFGLTMLAVCWLIAPVAQAAQERHVFDPTRSLTGRCTTEELDSVPDPWCPGPPKPSAPFESPNVVIDSYGSMYVGSWGKEGTDGRIDVFSPEGMFITEFSVEGPRALAVDTKGNFYVVEYVFGGVCQVSRYSPSTYEPASGEIEYSSPGVVIVPQVSPPPIENISCQNGLAVDSATDHLFLGDSKQVGEFSSAEEGNELIETIGDGVLSTLNGTYVAVDSSRNRLFVSDAKGGPDTSFIQVFELKAPHNLLGNIDGSDTPGGKFLSDAGVLTVDADKASGHIFVSDLDGSNKVYEFGAGLGGDEEFIESYQHKFNGLFPGEVTIDNSSVSPNRGTLYVPSGGTVDHIYAFSLVITKPPLVESISVSGITETEAVLRATINPEGASTSYRFEYTTQQSFEEEGGFASALIAGEGTLSPGIEGVNVTAALSGLQPGVAYRFRVVAESEAGQDQGEARFRTYPSTLASLLCPNDAVRTGLSSRLPDCRAYELVTPPDTNGRSPLGAGRVGPYFPTLGVSPQGDKATFRIEGGSLPGSEGSGAFSGENYLSTRGPEGWTTKLAAPSGTDSPEPLPGGVSPDQEYSFWGPSINGGAFRYIRYPDGHSEFVGRGSLGTDPKVDANLIAENRSHVIFTTTNTSHVALQLEPDAPPGGTTAVYDRTADGVTHVVSLLPGDLTPAAGQNASYVGASYDGEDIAFSIGPKLYLRHDNERTYEIGEGVTFAGIAEGGDRIFYMKGGDLFAFDLSTEAAIEFSESGDITPVNVVSDGSAAYLVSPSVLTSEPNPNGDTAQPEEENLYLSREGEMHLVGTVTALDVEADPFGLGLGSWVQALGGFVGQETSRTTPDGSVLLFQSEAQLGDYDPDGFTQIYRYDSVAGSLQCLSCNPTEAPTSSDASLQTVGVDANPQAPVSAFARMPNLRPDGRRAFFESSEPLVLGDTDGVQDVYEWEAQGVGSCTRPGGCVNLISSGQSARDDYLFSASEDGDDVLFLTSDLLLGRDGDETPSIYDARANGGFAESDAGAGECLGEACQPAAAVPAERTPASAAFRGAGNLTASARKRRCAKSKRRVRRHGKVRCVREHRKRAHAKRRAGR